METKEKKKTEAGKLFARKKKIEDCCRRVAGLRRALDEIESAVAAECDVAETEWLAAAMECEHKFAEIESNSHRRVYVCAKCGIREHG